MGDSHALVVVLALLLAKVAQRRLNLANVDAPSIAATLDQLQGIRRVTLSYRAEAPPALRVFAEGRWMPSLRSSQRQAMLAALGLVERTE